MISRGQLSLALYGLAAAVYITIGVLEPRFLLSWVEGAGFLLLAVWIVPAAIVYAISKRR